MVNILAPDVLRTDLRSLGRIGARWAWELSFGGAPRRVQPKSLLDTAPLRTLLGRIPLPRIDANVRGGLSTPSPWRPPTSTRSNGFLFVHGHPEIRPWKRRRCHIERAHLTIDHLMASSAIPIFFPSVRIGCRYFGNGCRSVLSCRHLNAANPFRWINVLWLTPSVDLGAIAAELSEHVPPIVRYLMHGLGSDEAITELLSYLLFAPPFTRRLIEIGRADAMAAKAEIRRFFAETSDVGKSRPAMGVRRR